MRKRDFGMTRREALERLGVLGFAATSTSQEEQTLPWADLTEAPASRNGVRFTELASIEKSVVPSEAFFVLQHGGIPELDPESFLLTLAGEVERPIVVDIDAIRALPKRERTVCFECAGNAGVGRHGLVGNASWGGVALATLLREAGVKPGARDIVFYGADEAEERLRGRTYPARFARSLPLVDALDDNVLLAYEMNGEPLSVEHGFPLRLIVPGWYGIAQVKWLTRIEVLDHRFMGWFMAKEYVSLRGEMIAGRIEHRAISVGRQRLKSVIARVTRRRASGGGWRYRIHGFAWNAGAEIARVEVRIDDGSFQPAELKRPGSRFAWTRFRVEWEAATPGRHRLVSRARDDEGVQPTTEAASRYKATPWENDGQVVREIEIPAG